MEDETRPLPKGWVRQFDSKQSHHFYVDTKTSPPRSIWHHPYDDDQYLSTLPSAERERIQELTRQPSMHDVMAWSSDEEGEHHPHFPKNTNSTGAGTSELPPRDTKVSGSSKFGRKMKDKLTQTTHEQREAERKKRAEEERLAYQAHLEFRRAMQKAEETGQPVKIGKDRDGKEVYVEPPSYGGGYPGYGSGSYGVSPYRQGQYSQGQDPNARYYRPQAAYGRPYGRGYGGGYGLPLAGGLAGGLLLGDMLGGGMGGMGMGGMGMMGGMGGMGMGGMGMGGMGL